MGGQGGGFLWNCGVNGVVYDVGESVKYGFAFGSIRKSTIDWDIVGYVSSEFVPVSAIPVSISYNTRLRGWKRGDMVAGDRSNDSGMFRNERGERFCNYGQS